MEKTETKEVKEKQIIHKFYCDKCNKYLNESIECDDGYYEEIGLLSLEICVFGKWYRYKGTFCEEHLNEKKIEIKEQIEKIGFKLEF